MPAVKEAPPTSGSPTSAQPFVFSQAWFTPLLANELLMPFTLEDPALGPGAFWPWGGALAWWGMGSWGADDPTVRRGHEGGKGRPGEPAKAPEPPQEVKKDFL